jgi:uncharacterized membrane protein
MVGWIRRQWHTHTVETLFLVMGLGFGLLFVFLVPPTQAADETTHFYRAYQLSDGDILSQPVQQGYGALLPRAVYTVSRQLFGNIPSHYDRKFNYHQIPALLHRDINSQDRIPVHIEGASVYSPAGYIPQVIAITLAKHIWPSVVFMYYLGRLANLALWLTLTYIALRLWPVSKWVLFAIALLPMSLSQAATLSPDATINSLAFLIISASLYFAKRQQRLSNKEVLFLVGAVAVLSLCKPVMFALGLLVLLLTRKQLGSRLRYWLVSSTTVGVGAILTTAWNFRIRAYSAGIDHYYYGGVHIDQNQQLHQVIIHPLHFVLTLGNSYFSSLGDVVARSFIGRLGWWDVDLPIWLVVSAYLLLALAILCAEPRDSRFSHRQRIICSSVFGLGFLAISLILYMTITAVGAPQIIGIQGRYFIAFAPLLAVSCFGLLRVQNWNRIAIRLYPLSYAGMLTISLLVMVNRFI